MNTTAIADMMCAVFMGILYVRNFSNRSLSKSSRLLNVCLAAMLASLLIDAAAYTFIGPAYPVPFRFLINLLSFEAACVNVFLFTFYEEALFEDAGKVNPWFFRVIKIVEVIWAFATAYEFIAGHLITYGTNGVENLDYVFPAYITVLDMAVQLYLLAMTIVNSRKIGRNLAGLLSVFFIAPIISSVLFSFLGVDFAYAFGAVMLGLVAEFIQRKQTQRIKEEQQDKLSEALTFTNYFLDTYVSAYYVNLNSCAYQVYKRPKEQNEKYPVIDNYYESFKAYINREVHPDNRAELIEVFSPEKLKSILKEAPEYALFYRSVAYDPEHSFRAQIIRGADENHAAIGFIDVTEELEEQQKHLLGAMPLSNDVLTKANIGMWAFELDDGKPPRMYDDETMLGLVGLDHQVPPEEAYHAWYDHIDEGSYDIVNDAVAKMMDGEHAEVQYPWHYPDGRTIMVRCGGVRNYGYTKGIRIEGTHQNVTETLHFDEEERQRAKQTERDLILSRLRADSLAYIEDNEPDLNRALDFFGKRILEITGCDEMLFRGVDGSRIVIHAPGMEDISEEICSGCPFSDTKNAIYDEDGTVLMNDCREGCRGVMTHPMCPAKSSFMQRIHSGSEFVGILAVHYLNDYHSFTDNGIEIMKTVAVSLGLLIGRIKEKQAEIARIEAESANKAKTEFLFNMSHDIRTPMNAILGYTDIGLRHVEDVKKSKDSFIKIKSAGGHLLNLINDILEMSRIESGKIELAEEPVDVRMASRDIHYMSESLAAPKSIDLKIEVGNLKNPYLYADELHVSELIINLISNAVKYTSEGGCVTYSVDQISDVIDGKVTYRFEIADNGIGMSEEFQRHLFEAFSREQTSTVSRIEGTGLGLSIVKKIVDMSGGTIRVKSKQNVGSTFTVEIPFKVMDDAAIEAYRASNAKVEDPVESVSLAGKKVLLVEDNEMNREIAAEILEESGLLVEMAEDGEVAVKTILNKGLYYYDFVLMDIQMPVMNGYEATKAIRALPNGNHIPIIALSANAFEEDRQKSLAAGMNDHVAKPINMKELFSALAKNL